MDDVGVGQLGDPQFLDGVQPGGGAADMTVDGVQRLGDLHEMGAGGAHRTDGFGDAVHAGIHRQNPGNAPLRLRLKEEIGGFQPQLHQRRCLVGDDKPDGAVIIGRHIRLAGEPVQTQLGGGRGGGRGGGGRSGSGGVSGGLLLAAAQRRQQNQRRTGSRQPPQQGMGHGENPSFCEFFLIIARRGEDCKKNGQSGRNVNDFVTGRGHCGLPQSVCAAFLLLALDKSAGNGYTNRRCMSP